MQSLMTKTEIKERAQYMLLNDGAGAFIFINENCIEPLENDERIGQEFDANELENWKAVYAEMERQFDRMKKFFLFEGFQPSH